MGVYLDHHVVPTYVFEKGDSSTPKKHYFEMYQNRWKISGKFLDPLGENLDLRFNVLYSKMHGFMQVRMNFQTFSGEGLTSPDPLPALNLGLRRRLSGACVFGSGFALNSPLQHV